MFSAYLPALSPPVPESCHQGLRAPGRAGVDGPGQDHPFLRVTGFLQSPFTGETGHIRDDDRMFPKKFYCTDNRTRLRRTVGVRAPRQLMYEGRMPVERTIIYPSRHNSHPGLT